jgi:hypothetical protein
VPHGCGSTPSFAAIDLVAAHSDGYSVRCSSTMRSARSRISDGYKTQGSAESPVFPGPLRAREAPVPGRGDPDRQRRGVPVCLPLARPRPRRPARVHQAGHTSAQRQGRKCRFHLGQQSSPTDEARRLCRGACPQPLDPATRRCLRSFWRSLLVRPSWQRLESVFSWRVQ